MTRASRFIEAMPATRLPIAALRPTQVRTGGAGPSSSDAARFSVPRCRRFDRSSRPGDSPLRRHDGSAPIGARATRCRCFHGGHSGADGPKRRPSDRRPVRARHRRGNRPLRHLPLGGTRVCRRRGAGVTARAHQGSRLPATIAGGATCATPGLECASAAPIYTCAGGQITGYASCACSSGVWVCPTSTCVEAGAPPPSCPAPGLIHEGVACGNSGEECPGNPTMCSGAQTFYDVFQCTKADLWTRIVAAVCGDGG